MKIRNNRGEKRPGDRRYRYLTLPVHKSGEKQRRYGSLPEDNARTVPGEISSIIRPATT